ncbi:MAG: hypothetical protein M4579_003490 [Chaenotheca gracillima]|nr:MAG: hypothetical protein M4579_003490 [Chaenotheca gracillima]
MSTQDHGGVGSPDPPSTTSPTPQQERGRAETGTSRGWMSRLRPATARQRSSSRSDELNEKAPRPRWTMGLLNDRETDEVPGSVILLSASDHNEPLGLRNAPARTSASSLPSPYPSAFSTESRRRPEKKKTPDGQIVLDPQPDESPNDPLNWPAWRRDVALLSLGFYCMIGGGMTPILAAGFQKVADSYDVSIPQVALTTGLYMMGLGLGSVISSPTAILYGKRPVYLVGIILFCLSSIWCALSPNYASLVVARIVQGIAVSPCESLPSATIAEIFFLHERAYRVGIYTLLLLGGKNLIPLVSAAIIQGLDWQWVFWIVAMVVGLCFFLLFFFVPETFWDRAPRPKPRRPGLASHRTMSSIWRHKSHPVASGADGDGDHGKDRNTEVAPAHPATIDEPGTIAHRRRTRNTHVGFAPTDAEEAAKLKENDNQAIIADEPENTIEMHGVASTDLEPTHVSSNVEPTATNEVSLNEKLEQTHPQRSLSPAHTMEPVGPPLSAQPTEILSPGPSLSGQPSGVLSPSGPARPIHYTTHLASQPARTFTQTLRPWNGRLRKDNWFHVACRPFILFAYPAVLWSTVVYSLSVGWLIVLSESVTVIYGVGSDYNFAPLSVGLIYLSPFIGGVLGTAVAGKVSDIIVRYMSRRNGGLYEPEFRLVMAIPVALTTAIGLMGYGWAAEEKDLWIVPTIFFGIISFGCSLGSTTAITFCVDSYRQYAGEALVTLNFSKNVFHGLIFSLFFNRWLEADGSKTVFVALGAIQLACLSFTIPLYIFGKRARMWTVRKNLMEKF